MTNIDRSSYRCNPNDRSVRHFTDGDVAEVRSQGALIPERLKDVTSIYGGVSVSQTSRDRGNNAEFHAHSISTERDSSSTWSPAVHNLLDRPPSTFPRRAIAGGIVFFLAFSLWAWYGRINEVGRASGKLVPRGEAQKIYSEEMGQVSRLEVEEGEAVSAGQILVELDPQVAASEVERLEQQSIAYQTQREQTQTLIDRVLLESRMKAMVIQADLQAQRAAIAESETRATTTQAVIERLNDDIVAIDSRQQAIEPLENNASHLINLLQQQVREHQERVEQLKPLLAEGAISRERLFQAEQSLRDSENALIRAKMSDRTIASERLFDLGQSRRDRNTRLIEHQGKLEESTVEYERLVAQLAQKEAEGRQAQLAMQQQIEKLQLELSELNGKIAETQTLLKRAKIQLKRRFLYAPVDGTVLSLNVNHSGDMVNSGQVVAEIAPQNSDLVLSANLLEKEAGFVEVGMPVRIKLDAYPFQEYGIIEGRVVTLSPDAKTDPNVGEVYGVEIELERDYVMEGQTKISFKPGQTAEAEIVVRSRRIFDVIADPIKQLREGGISF